MEHIIHHALHDTIGILPFLFMTYLAIELLERYAGEKTVILMGNARWSGPLLGALFGIFPQCGFSVSMSGLYARRVITRGSLLAVFLATSDEMLPILISKSAPVSLIIRVLFIKFAAAAAAGLLVDWGSGLLPLNAPKEKSPGDDDGCSCHHRNVLMCALTHTLKIFLFLLAVTILFTALVETVGPDRLAGLILNRPVLGELLAGLIGLIPNCASSVIITELYLQGGMSASAMLSGLMVGSGVGLLVLFRMNTSWKDSLVNLLLLYCSGVLLGMLLGPILSL